MPTEHHTLADDELHRPHRQIFADDTARTGDTTTYTSADLGHTAFQVDTGTVYVLTAISPTTWTDPTATNTAAIAALPTDTQVVGTWVPVYPGQTAQPDTLIRAPFAGTVQVEAYTIDGTVGGTGTVALTVTKATAGDVLDAVDIAAGLGAPAAIGSAVAVAAGDRLDASLAFAAGITPAASDGVAQASIGLDFIFVRS